MALTFNIALLVTGGITFLTGFGGKTWKEGNEPIFERITPRGWVALICFVITLATGISREFYADGIQKKKDADASIAAQQAKIDVANAKLEADEKQRVLQEALSKTAQALAVANAKIKGLQRENELTRDQLTGGDGFPEAWIFTTFPDTDGSFTLQLMVMGATPLTDVSLTVTQGPYVKPTPEEIQQGIARSAQALNGHPSGPPPMFVGTLHPNVYQSSNAHIQPKADGSVNTYRIYLSAMNGSVLETLDIRFNKDQKLWQSRFKVVSDRARDGNKVLNKQDWAPRRNVILVGEGAPTNRKPKE